MEHPSPPGKRQKSGFHLRVVYNKLKKIRCCGTRDPGEGSPWAGIQVQLRNQSSGAVGLGSVLAIGWRLSSVPCRVDLSVGQLTTWQMASIRARSH
ncbi:uncharacterized protein [Equus caballus]|uniref:uncharacterized protein n=1 Tax=Equus caballus TaxID=9796 RepID=UPI0038B36C31